MLMFGNYFLPYKIKEHDSSNLHAMHVNDIGR